MTQKTPLYEHHLQAGGKMVDFGGWQLPVHYGSLVDEHHCVRNEAGVFDVSHMTIVDIDGADSTAFLQRLFANDVARLTDVGAALYSCMLNDEGGIIDDLIVYWLGDHSYRVIVNAATREKDLEWIGKQSEKFNVTITERPELALVAVQGPLATERAVACLPEELKAPSQVLKRYTACTHDEWFVAATGYTGEAGLEIAMPQEQVCEFWNALLEAGVKPCGLGARDTLRLEAGMNLYGSDMDETQSPLSSDLAWTVAWQPAEREFIGRAALQQQVDSGVEQKLCGFVLDGKGVLRGGQVLYKDDAEIGVITSGTFSPTLKKSIAFARVNADSIGDCMVQIRNNRIAVKHVKRVFVRKGQPV